MARTPAVSARPLAALATFVRGDAGESRSKKCRTGSVVAVHAVRGHVFRPLRYEFLGDARIQVLAILAEAEIPVRTAALRRKRGLIVCSNFDAVLEAPDTEGVSAKGIDDRAVNRIAARRTFDFLCIATRHQGWR